jgi:DNA invertase Pin-like site-specific DNA recombinase
MQELQAANVGLYLHTQNLDSTTPSGKAMLQMLGVFAEFERSMIQARVKAGMERAALAGRKPGPRPLETKDPARYAEAVRLIGEGLGNWQVAQRAKIGISTAIKIRAALAAQQEE